MTRHDVCYITSVYSLRNITPTGTPSKCRIVVFLERFIVRNKLVVLFGCLMEWQVVSRRVVEVVIVVRGCVSKAPPVFPHWRC